MSAKVLPASTRRTVKITADQKEPFLKLWKLGTQPIAVTIVKPKDYFSASNELTVFALVVCWIITLAYDWRLAWDHPARNLVGHMKPCFGWDYAPASYVAVCCAGVDVFLAFRYATLEALRTRLLDTDGRSSWAERFALVTAYAHAVAAVFWLLLWSIGPPDGNWTAHLAIFSVCVFFRYLCTLGNYVEQRFGDARQMKRVRLKHTVFVCFYGAVTALLPILYFTDVIVCRAQGRVGVDPPIPWPILQVLDLVWCACLAMTNFFAVPEPPIQITRKILQFDEEFEVDEKEAMLGLKGRNGRTLAGVEISACAVAAGKSVLRSAILSLSLSLLFS